MEYEGSLPHSQAPTTCPYLEAQSMPLHPISSRSILFKVSHLPTDALFIAL
jgi:hypothetical protein